jgi:uncharacterized protein (DUF1800 family)
MNVTTMMTGLAAMRQRLRGLAAATSLVLLAACGGGSGGGGSDSAPADLPPTRSEAARFLTQASFGPTEASIDRVMALGYAAWIDEQLALPQTSHRSYWDAENAAIRALDASRSAGSRQVLDSFYQRAIHGEDQLRQRVAFALSQIFVVSMQDSNVGNMMRGVPAYLDMLGKHGLGSYRRLLEQVARSPVMGAYLSHLGNMKEDAARGRVPDENFAREVMQLFSIGLYELNPDGSARLGGDGRPIETYGAADVSGLAKVFTGWSYNGPDTADSRFYGWDPATQDPARLISPMQGYSQFHSLAVKKFLGKTVAAQTHADPQASLKLALDTLARHPNVGPFIGRQLIQRLVTSNPSPAYVQRVAQAFDAGGSENMAAMVRAILLDPEARDPTRATDPAFGKLREPVLRLTALLRAFPASSDSGKFLIGTTSDNGTQLGQTPLYAPSVFNFYRPGYLPPNTLAAAGGLVAPEMQITHETTIAGYANYMRYGIQYGFGQYGEEWNAKRPDVQLDFSAEAGLAGKPRELVAQVATRLLGQAAPMALEDQIAAAVASIEIPKRQPGGANAEVIAAARKNRVFVAVLLTLVAPEFLIQK